MKTCDFCSKQVVFLQDLEYCSVCDDCFIEMNSEKDDLLDSLSEKKDENQE